MRSHLKRLQRSFHPERYSRYRRYRRPPPKCHPGTRILLLNRLSDWVQDAAKRSARDRAIADFQAPAGPKSHRMDFWQAPFFFCRTDTNRNSIKGLVPTLAYQISYSIVNSQFQIAKAVADNPMIFYQSFQTQFKSSHHQTGDTNTPSSISG